MCCGIAGYYGLDDKNLLKDMISKINHRGPDDENYFLDNNIGLAIARLSIIDVEGGRQPICNEDGTIHIVFNGEIYNYIELRNILSNKGHSFYTQTDTEVIVHAYEQYGEDCLQFLRGMFAFAIWDGINEKLFIARDRFGKKPLFYFHNNNTILFCSEMKGILSFEEVPKEIDKQAIYLYLNYFFVPHTHCVFKYIKKLPPASYLVFQKGKLYVRRYWDLNFTPKLEGDMDSWIEELFNELVESVKIRLRSDVPLGCLLSGGIDSSVVASVASKVLNKDNLTTFSVGFLGQENHDLYYANLVAEHLSTDHHEVIVEPETLEILPKLIWHIDEPFGDSSIIPMYKISQVARRIVKVVLTGDGGDEIFMGYPWMLDSPKIKSYVKLRRLIPSAVSRHLPRWTPKKIIRFFQSRYIDPDPFKRYFSRISHLSPEEIKQINIVRDLGLDIALEPTYVLYELCDKVTVKSEEDLFNYLTIKTYLADDILVKVDRMSMAVSLEARCPLLDHVLASKSFMLPYWAKYKKGETKIILKKMVIKKNLLPKEIIERKKRGFSAPISVWFGEGWIDLLENRLLESKFISKEVGLDFVMNLLREPVLNARKLFALTTLSIWYDIYIEGVLKPTDRL